METNEISILIYTFTIILLALGTFLLLFYLLFKKKQKSHKMKIIALNQEILQTQIEIQEQTLKNVSQEIHDNIGQVLILAKLNLGTLNNIRDEANQEKLKSTKDLVSKAINDLRDLSRSMHGEKIAEVGLQISVENELKFLQNTGKFQTHLDVIGQPYKFSPQVQMLLFRILQEALHNQIKHSKAKNVSIQFDYGLKEFILTLNDDGIGFNKEKLEAAKTGIGLKSMQNRAALIGGELTINSSENKGTTIIIKISKDIPNIAVN